MHSLARLTMVVALLFAACGQPPAAEQVADQFVQAYFVQNDMAAAVALTAGKARASLAAILQQIEAAGISKAIASRAVDEAFQDLDPDALLLASLAKRLRGRERIADEREFQRLFRYLSAQGFETEKILAHLRKYQSR